MSLTKRAATAIVFSVVLTAAVIPTAIPLIDYYEFTYQPVVHPTNTEITLIRSDGEHRVRAWGLGKRLRECDFDELHWYVGSRQDKRASRVVVEFEEGAKIRPTGEFTWGPWRIYLSEKQLNETSFADAYHRCKWSGYYLPWRTRSPFWG